MKRFILDKAIVENMKQSCDQLKITDAQIAYGYCPGCSNSGCTGSAQYGCDSCSSCSSWAGGR